ncbi:hypothetical protein J31TS4_15130 [Paenibacillus sp. J31TS4]|uniref:FIMAH domain-containing protein n=1 Tax=Paenibacillus sp. J31TS4 TaxID=2807195 RepID=UPI001B14D4B7|nr:heparinase II/III family protein [Paenibacillus sp. J31TS4]GIP38233.1 hypothetical protein J31TS4_15130 [Paenibacillus sp. J31TS4]
MNSNLHTRLSRHAAKLMLGTMLLSVCSGLLPAPGQAAESAIQAEDTYVMPDTTVYSFGKLGLPGQPTQPGWSLVGDPAAAPSIAAQSYGAQIKATAEGQSRSFSFEAPAESQYLLRLQGYYAPGGGTADVQVDGVPRGRYSFYSTTGGNGSLLFLDTLDLTQGTHTLTLTAAAKGSGTGRGTGLQLYPTELHLVNLSQVTSSKQRSTIYTQTKLDAARANAQQYDWAQTQLAAAKTKADPYLAAGYETLWSMMSSQEIPRSYNTNQLVGNLSPVSGDLKSYGNYPWKANPLEEPWKLIDPASGKRFPTNDFAAYYKSGLDEHGNFDPNLANRDLLVNTLYPEMGPTWGVDDGYGWVDPATGTRYTFIAYYAHWFAWYSTGAVWQALTGLRDAYVYTGDLRYARAGAILLDRVADLYPAMDISTFDSKIYVNSHGGAPAGKVIGSIWESTFSKDLANAYDAFYPVFDDPEVVAFLKQKGEQYNLPLKENGTQIRRNIEDGILRQMYPAFKESKNRGNNGFHQSTLATAAVVLDTLPETKTWLDYVFQPGGFVNKIPYQVTGGNVLFSMVNDVDRDGMGNEAAPGYNVLWLNTYQQVADILRGYDKYPAADLYNNVKFRKMFSSMYPLVMLGKYTPQIGDSGSTGNPGLTLNKAQTIKAFEVYGDSVFAQMAYFQNNNTTDGIHSDIFTPDPNKIARDIQAVIDREGPYDASSVNLTGYGFAALRDGEASAQGDTRRDVWTYYGRNGGHGHSDSLNLGMHAFGIDMLPDLGYPEQANATDVNRYEWVNNTISHNTVQVGKTRQKTQVVAEPKQYDNTAMVKLTDQEAPLVYPQTDLYKRTTAMIRVDGQNSYAVDFFRVKGGSDHVFSFHAAEGPATAEGLTLTPQPTGTYAGPGVEFGVRPAGDSVSGSGYVGPGYHWLKNVERDENPASQFSVDWKVTDTWKVLPGPQDLHLRLTMLGHVDDVALADGVPPQNKPGNPKSLRYLLAHRAGQNLDSLFTSVIEPYKDNRFVTAISPATVTADGAAVGESEATAVKVQLASGRTDYIVSSLNPDKTYTVDGRIAFRGTFGVYSEQNGETAFTYVNDGSFIRPASETGAEGIARLTGTLLDFTKEMSLSNSLTVQMDLQGLAPDKLVGRMIYVNNDKVRNAVYRIKGVTPAGSGRYTLELGDITLIRSYKSTTDLNQGFLYDVAEGAAVTIPLSSERIGLTSLEASAGKETLHRSEETSVQLSGWYADGKPANFSVTGAVYTSYSSDRPDVVSVDASGRLTAGNPGTATVTASVYLANGLTRQAQTTLTVDVTPQSLLETVSRLAAEGELGKPLQAILTTHLATIEHHLAKGDSDKALKQADSLWKQLEKEFKPGDTSERARQILRTDLEALTAQWRQ